MGDYESGLADGLQEALLTLRVRLAAHKSVGGRGDQIAEIASAIEDVERAHSRRLHELGDHHG